MQTTGRPAQRVPDGALHGLLHEAEVPVASPLSWNGLEAGGSAQLRHRVLDSDEAELRSDARAEPSQ